MDHLLNMGWSARKNDKRGFAWSAGLVEIHRCTMELAKYIVMQMGRDLEKQIKTPLVITDRSIDARMKQLKMVHQNLWKTKESGNE